MTPLLFLDVDGVLNALTDNPDPSIWPDWQHTQVRNRINSFPICWSPSVVARLVGWHKEGLAEIHWLTTWLGDANGELGTRLGLPQWPVVGSHLTEDPARSSGGDPFGWWKADLVDEILAHDPKRPFVWLDDDLRVQPRLLARLRAEHDCLLVGPFSETGLTPSQLDRVDTWLRAHTPTGD